MLDMASYDKNRFIKGVTTVIVVSTSVSILCKKETEREVKLNENMHI